jgi:predicted nucleic acid-binding protein
MPDVSNALVTNTTPLIALTAATGSLDVLKALYSRIVVPSEVADEIRVGGSNSFGLDVFQQAHWLELAQEPLKLWPYLSNTLDKGEASVIQTAIQMGISKVCIDETVGRRVARLSNLTVTGSIGILLKAKAVGFPVDMATAVARMRSHGIWLSQDVIRFALSH